MKKILFFVSLFLGIASLVLTFTGLPGSYDTEPLLAVGLVCLAVAGMVK